MSQGTHDIVKCLLNDILPNGGAVVMLKAYIDTGAKKEHGGVVSTAAAVFSPLQYDLFVHEWQPMLDGWGAKAFHATDFYCGGGEFRRNTPERMQRFDRDARAIPGIIAKHVHKLFMVSFNQDEYERVAPAPWRQRFGGVYRVASQALTGGIGHWANRAELEGDIAYFYETGDKDEASVRDAYQKVFDDPVQRAHTRMASTPIGVPKGRARGLEVADFLAWHWNKFYVATEALSKPIVARADIRKLMELLEVREDKIELAVLTGQNLENFLIAHGCVRGVAAKASS